MGFLCAREIGKADGAVNGGTCFSHQREKEFGNR